jgi:GT2 family glycosyltransferase
VISIIICSVDAENFTAVQKSYARSMGREAYEIVAIHDARSLCEGYNRGLLKAKGDICVFSHDDIEILSDDLGGKLRRYLGEWDVVGVAGTTLLRGMGWASSGIQYANGVVTRRVSEDYEIQLLGAPAPVIGSIQALDGIFFATRREVAETIGFDAETFDGWHGYDTDFTFRCYRAGYRIAVCLDLRLVHFSLGNLDAAWLRYDARFRSKHAAHLSSAAGRWLEVWKRVRTREEVVAAYDFAELCTLTEEVRRRATA